MITTTIVTSKDGVGFSVRFYSRTEAQARIAERAEAVFAAHRLAVELESFGDYHRLDPLTGYVQAPQLSPPRRVLGRPVLTVIRGGKP